MPDNSRKAYVLDDVAAIGAVVCRVLETCGHQATAFSDPETFLSALEASPPDLAILDLALGRSDAIEVMRKLEALRYQGDIVLMSGRSSEILSEINQIGISRGLSMLPPLDKPFRPEEVKARLRSVPERKQVAVRTGSQCQKIDLAEAIEKKWLELWYQPKIDLATFSVCGAEALLRIRHPERGVLLPGEFLPPVGDPIYHPISDFVLETALADSKKMATQNVRTKISINMPVSVLLNPGFVAQVRSKLPTDEDFSGLMIEVTEDEVVRDPQTVREIAIQLKLSSVELSIDDFGTAHASLARLRDLPCSEVKLEKSFVLNCSSDAAKRNICQTVADLAQKFKLSACAEGVETQEDLNTLTAMGFNTAQGYLFSKPMPLDLFIAMMLTEGLSKLKMGVSPPQEFAAASAQHSVAAATYARNAQARRDISGLPLNYFFSVGR